MKKKGRTVMVKLLEGLSSSQIYLGIFGEGLIMISGDRRDLRKMAGSIFLETCTGQVWIFAYLVS